MLYMIDTKISLLHRALEISKNARKKISKKMGTRRKKRMVGKKKGKVKRLY